jgi:MFS family permease
MSNVLRHNSVFLRFWIATIASELASRMHSLILIWIVYKWTNSAFYVGMAMVAASLPAVLISPYAGSIVDRKNKVVVMFTADFIRLALVSLFAWLFYIGHLNTYGLIVGTMGISLASAFFNPSSLAIIPSLVSKEQITQANAIEQISGSASSIIGPLFGSAIIATLGVTKAFIAAGILFLVSVIFLVNIKDVSHNLKKNATPIWEDIKSGWELVKHYTIVYKMIIRMAVVNFFFSSLTILIPLIVKGDVKEIAYLMSAVGAGMLTGSLLLSGKKFAWKVSHILAFSFFAIGLSFVGAAFSDILLLLLIEMFVIGFFINVFNINLISLYQLRLPRESLGKIMSLIIALSLSLQPISYGLMGAVAGSIGSLYTFLISGLVILLAVPGVYRLKELNVNTD